VSGIRQSQLYAIRTTVGQEKSVALLIAERAKSLGLNIYSVIAPEEMKGYVIIEAAARHEVHQVIMGLRHVRSKVIGNISIEEIKHFLIPKPPTEGLEVGDVVEVIGGPFKGEKAVITQIKPDKEEVTLQLLSSSYPIPIIVNASYIKLIEKGKHEGMI